MRIANAFVIFTAVGTFACGSKKSSEGLPPATEWGAGGAAGATREPQVGPGETLVPMEGAKPKSNDSLPPGHPPIDPNGGTGQMGGSEGDNHPPVVAQTPPKTLDKLPDGRLGLGPIAITVPAGWTEVPTTSDMRYGQFAAGDAELVIFWFGKDGAGSVEDNLNRWAGQFTSPDGKASDAKIEKLQVLGQEATLVSVSGKMQAMAMGSTPAVEKTDQAMLGAITGSPNGPYYWKMTGPKATIAANDAKFRALLTGLKLK
ncbi:MAG: hypothetical protein NT062_26585 [Proteobacteria bacterium]|nr:hypothetical protein [Pseudomonadota bacterium]